MTPATFHVPILTRNFTSSNRKRPSFVCQAINRDSQMPNPVIPLHETAPGEVCHADVFASHQILAHI
ncbi:predicted protein [Plenodomus lingam JN3]|uniref:Predicted protein n=1 Tax=Leptosphaeria maculans (strain JN3 / isolate v23.1.3 / race Av1-4-5-6-7-8) TaxID=985895 RepID=E4ZIF7_LEPMJ|nr:predicted protein [Plenodomus lingam JN3]CBX90978.1 predicted protein [Plenodomus lingam JN3]